MISSRTNIKALAGLIAASGHGPGVYYQPEPPEILAENLLRTARMEGADLIWVPDEDRPAALALVRPLDWDTRFFGFPCALIDTLLARGDSAERFQAARAAVSMALDRCRAKGVRFLSAKIPGPDPAVIQALECNGFYTTNINLCLTWTGQVVQTRSEAPGFRFTTRIDDPGSTARIFRRLFYDGRFHNDPRIPAETADALWEAAILNQLETEASHMLFLQKEEQIVGLATVKPLDRASKTGALFVFGVVPEYRGLGLGAVLLSGLLERIQGQFHRLEVETSSFNLPAITMYRHGGFFAGRAKVALHWWRSEVSS